MTRPLLLLACIAVSSCSTPRPPRHVNETLSLHGPFMSGSSWWIPTNPWNNGLPCGSVTDPRSNVDIDADGRADGFALGRPTTDDRGNTTQMVCIAREAHLIVNGKSVGKCPWLGGRNHVLTYYADQDCNGNLDDDDGNGRPDELGWTVLVSMDGPLPPIANVSLGEQVVSEGRVIDVTIDNYDDLIDSLGNPIDSDRDGLVDVTAYYRRTGAVTKRHFEIDPRTGAITEAEDDQVTFEPTDPALVPDDLGLRLPTIANVGVANVAIASVASTNVASTDASIANVSIATDWLPRGMVVRTTEALEVSGRSHAIAAEVTHGLPIEVVPVSDGFVFHFVPLRSTGSITLRIDESTQSERGWTGLPTVSMDGTRSTDASRDASGTVIVEAEFSGAHSISLEVRFTSEG
jgi:hypothetical protein